VVVLALGVPFMLIGFLLTMQWAEDVWFHRPGRRFPRH
jgi:hypothetical protein